MPNIVLVPPLLSKKLRPCSSAHPADVRLASDLGSLQANQHLILIVVLLKPRFALKKMLQAHVIKSSQFGPLVKLAQILIANPFILLLR